MRLLSRGLLAVLLLTSSPASLRAVDSYCPNADPARRTILVSALDSQGNPVAALAAADLRAQFRGQPVKLVSLRPARATRVVILLDISHSMAETPAKWRLGVAAAEDILTRLDASIELGLVVFDSSVRETVGLDAGRPAVAQRLASLRPLPWSPRRGDYDHPVAEAIQAGLELLGSGRPGDVLYVVTDARQFLHDLDKGMSEAEEALATAGVRLFAAEFPAAIALAFSAGRIKQIAGRTGGDLLHFKMTTGRDPYLYDEKDRADLFRRAARLYAQMESHHRLEIELSRSLDKLQDWKLEIVDERGRRRKDLTLIYPRKLAPCPGHP